MRIELNYLTDSALEFWRNCVNPCPCITLDKHFNICVVAGIVSTSACTLPIKIIANPFTTN
jgi:hypothetical protein